MAGVSVNPPPLVRLPKKLLDDPELKPYFLALEEERYKSWIRSGGETDSVFNLDESVTALEIRVASLEGRTTALEGRMTTAEEEIEIILGLTQVDRQNVADLIANSGKLKALIGQLQSSVRSAKQMLAGIEQ